MKYSLFIVLFHCRNSLDCGILSIVPVTMAQGGDDLAIRLHDWAVNEMKYRPSGRHAGAGLPTPEDFRR